MTDSRKTSQKLAAYLRDILGPRGNHILKMANQELIDEVIALEDDFHTKEELYDFRMVMHAHLAIMWHRFNMYPVVKSFRHHDGEECFDGNYFIVVAQLPTGQISNHYKKEYWGMFQIPNQEFAPKWDGHNSQDVLKRLTEELASLPIAIMNAGDNDTRS